MLHIVYIYIYIIHVYVALVFNIIHWNYQLGRFIILSHIHRNLLQLSLKFLAFRNHPRVTRRIISGSYPLAERHARTSSLVWFEDLGSPSHCIMSEAPLWNVESYWNNQLFHDFYLINERFCGSRLLQKVGLGLWWIGSMILTKNPAQDEMVSVTPLPKGWTPETRNRPHVKSSLTRKSRSIFKYYIDHRSM